MELRTAAQRKPIREMGAIANESGYLRFWRGEEGTFQQHILDLVDIGRIPSEKAARGQMEARSETRHSIGLVAFLRSILRNGWRADADTDVR